MTMIFELIDSKKICDSCYLNGEIVPFSAQDEYTHTWDYTPLLGEKQYELASLYAGTKNIEDACNFELKDRYLSLKSKTRAYLKSLITSKISLEENCFFDLVPVSFIHELFSVRAEMMQNIFETYGKPDNYDFMYELNKLSYEISERAVKVDIKKMPQIKLNSTYKKKVRYNIFGTITGRMASEQDSFPILTLDKKNRGIIEPTNNYLLELDYNAFEPRVLLSLTGEKQPDIDLHEWNRENIFHGMDREESKKKLLTWLYDERSTTTLLDPQTSKLYQFYDKISVKNKYYKNGVVTNYYGRKMSSDKEHALNYIIQSTGSDTFLRQAIKINNLLKGKKSFIKFLIHDSIVFDMDSGENDLLKTICSEFENTELGKFKISKKIGKNYGNMAVIQ